MDMNTQALETHPEIIPLPAFGDNYLWLIKVGRQAAVVDPGDGDVVEAYLSAHALELTAILITHHHADHVGGIQTLTAGRRIPVYGPAAPRIPGVTIAVAEGDVVELPEQDIRFQVLEVPGHTSTHIAFLAPGILFPGDTLFSAGCGRLLGGTAEQLHASLQRLKRLPEETRVYCTHEYTLANLAFAVVAEPGNEERDAWYERCRGLRAQGAPTLPSTIGREKRINPFLRTDEERVRHAVASHNGKTPNDALACFTALRNWKDGFRG